MISLCSYDPMMNNETTLDYEFLKTKIRNDGRTIRRIAEDSGFPPHVLYNARRRAKSGLPISRGTVALVASALRVEPKSLLKEETGEH